MLLSYGGLQANVTHHFFLEIVTSKHIVSEVLSSYTCDLLAIKPFLIKIIFLPPFLSRSHLNGGGCERCGGTDNLQCEIGHLGKKHQV